MTVFSSELYPPAPMLTGKSSVGGIRDSVLIFLMTESFAQTLKKALEVSGHRSIVAITESAAFIEAKANVPSLILLDRGSGSVVNFRRLSTLSRVPIVSVQEGHLSSPD